MSFLAQMTCSFHLEVAHWMPTFPEGHPNSRMHGHSYAGTVVIKGPVDSTSGVVMEYSELKTVVDSMVSELDHRLMNKIPGLEIPTSENLSRFIWNFLKPKLPSLFEVRLERASVGMSVSYFGEELP